MINTLYLAPPVFFFIAFVFSMLGMGGSQLYIPILFWLGMDFKTQAIPLGMLLNVVNSSSAAITYGRKKLIDWRFAIPFGLSMILLAPVSSQKITMSIVAGGILGFFAGLIGRGGGSFVVPLLYIAGLEAKLAAATSAMVVTFSGLSSFVSHIFTAARPNWPIWALCVLAVLAGSQTGSRLMAGKLKSKSVKLIFGVVLLGVAVLLIVKDVILK